MSLELLFLFVNKTWRVAISYYIELNVFIFIYLLYKKKNIIVE